MELSFPNITFTRKNNTMKHFYHYLLTVFLAGQVPGWGQNATEKKHIFVNDSITVDLPEVFVKAERPLVKVSEGKLQYDIPNLVKDKPVDNAFDVTKKIKIEICHIDIINFTIWKGCDKMMTGR